MEGTTLGKLDFKTLDVSSMESVRNFAAAVKKDYPKIHVLINNGKFTLTITKTLCE